MKTTHLDIHRLNKNFTMTVEVHVTHEWRVRMAIAKFFIRLAANILGCNIIIDEKHVEHKS